VAVGEMEHPRDFVDAPRRNDDAWVDLGVRALVTSIWRKRDIVLEDIARAKGRDKLRR
jgi:hypothetical protein